MATLYDEQGQPVEVPDAVLTGEGVPKGLRDHAKSLEDDLRAEREARETERRELEEYKRRDAFVAAAAEAGVEGVTLEDLGQVDPAQISPALLKVKAEEKAEAQRAVLAEQAKAAGYETVEQFQEALRRVKEEQNQSIRGTQDQASIALGGSPSSPPPAAPKTAGEVGIGAWEEAKQEGKAADLARADYVRAVIEQAGRPSA